MIITVRGPSGSGKSTLVRAIADCYPNYAPFYVAGRRKPIFTEYVNPNVNGKRLLILGHYEIANGGVDTLPTLDTAYAIAREHDRLDRNILMEGKCMSDGVSHVARLRHEGHMVCVVHLSTPIEQCVASVRQRGHNIAERTIVRTHRKVSTNMETFLNMGLPVFSGERTACLAHVRELLGIRE